MAVDESGEDYYGYAKQLIYTPDYEYEDFDNLEYNYPIKMVQINNNGKTLNILYNAEKPSSWKCQKCKEGYSWFDPKGDEIQGRCEACNVTIPSCKSCSVDNSRCLQCQYPQIVSFDGT